MYTERNIDQLYVYIFGDLIKTSVSWIRSVTGCMLRDISRNYVLQVEMKLVVFFSEYIKDKIKIHYKQKWKKDSASRYGSIK